MYIGRLQFHCLFKLVNSYQYMVQPSRIVLALATASFLVITAVPVVVIVIIVIVDEIAQNEKDTTPIAEAISIMGISTMSDFISSSSLCEIRFSEISHQLLLFD